MVRMVGGGLMDCDLKAWSLSTLGREVGSRDADLEDRNEPLVSGEFGATLMEGDLRTGMGEVGRLEATGTMSSAGDDTRLSFGPGAFVIRNIRSSFLQTMPRTSELPSCNRRCM